MSFDGTEGQPLLLRFTSQADRAADVAVTRMMHTMSKATPTGVQDRNFMMMMIPHHQSAIDMVKVELRRGTHPELKALARDVIKSQDKEIEQMQGLLGAWYGQRR